jgi:putative transposase
MIPLIEETSPMLSVQQLCRLARVARSSYYHHQRRSGVQDQPDVVRAELHCICEHYPAYGYRRVTHELCRRGHRVNHKRILALMRTERLLCRPKRRFIRTTDSRHGLPVYPNLARTLSVTRPNQLWVADLTYVRLVRGFAYVAVILDAFSRRAVGWALSSHVDTELSLRALTMALAARRVGPDLVHHSDQGVQYASAEYVALLTSRRITISMSRTGNPYDNAMAESFMKTLKTEEVYLNEYENLLDAAANIDHFIDQTYNKKRLHSSLGYQTPVEYEAKHHSSRTTTSSTLTTPETVSVYGCSPVQTTP